MNRISRFALLLLLLLGIGTTACYQPIDLTPAEDAHIPWVHCVLMPDTVQFLELWYIDASSSGKYRPVENAEVTLEVGRHRNWNGDFYYTSIPFQRAGSGQWQARVPMLNPTNLQEDDDVLHFRLQVVLPDGDTLRAETTFPLGSVKQDIATSSDLFISEFDLNGKHYSYPLADIPQSHPTLYRHEETCHFSLPSSNAVWIYKVGVAEDGKTFIEDALATNHEEWTDSFNRTGQTFAVSSEPWALSMYPDVAGRPLHFRYLRFPAGDYRGGEVVAISGDFKGPHYGLTGPMLQLAIADQAFEKAKAQFQGVPYEDNILTTRQAGYLQFLTVSTEYDKYLKDVAQAELLQENTDIVGIYDNTNIYSNIQGGTGIFGAQIPQTFYWSCGVWIFE